MDVVGFVPLLLPVALIVGAAAMVLVRARAGRSRDADVVLDLRDVPTVHLAREKDRWVPEHLRRWETTGELVSAGAGSLGARMQRAADVEQRDAHDQSVEQPRGRPPGRLVVRRRRRPLVAARR